MDLYSFVRIITERSALNLPQCERERLVGTLRAAGFSESLTTKRDKEQALAVVTSHLRRSVKQNLRTAAAPKQGAELFHAIKELNDARKCGKCKGPTEKVKLASGEDVNYCTSCRVTLWQK